MDHPEEIREKANLAHLGDITAEGVVYVGKVSMKLGEALALRPGSVVVLPRLAGEAFELWVNGAWLGEGETAVLGSTMALRLTRMAPLAQQEVLP
ncbi:MAG: FliM/FliN family flagellar motor switch protein [Candidatus Latescibacteria bacterium]|nr:FliM/FliN family flagellar motor switch protein [Candidatus Latescibacterota bacterium]